MCFVLYLFHEHREFSLGHDNCKISISGKLIFMGENFMLLLLLFRAKNIDNLLFRSHVKYKIGYF